MYCKAGIELELNWLTPYIPLVIVLKKP